MSCNAELFDRVVFEATFTDVKITKADYAQLDKITRLALMIYENGDIQYLQKMVQKLPEIYNTQPERLVPLCKDLIKRCDSLISNLEILEEEFKHRGDLAGYKKNVKGMQIIQLIGTLIIVAVSSLLQLEIPFIAAGGTVYNAFFISKNQMMDAKDMDIYKAYKKIKKEDPLTLCQTNIANLKIMRRNLRLLISS